MKSGSDLTAAMKKPNVPRVLTSGFYTPLLSGTLQGVTKELCPYQTVVSAWLLSVTHKLVGDSCHLTVFKVFGTSVKGVLLA